MTRESTNSAAGIQVQNTGHSSNNDRAVRFWEVTNCNVYTILSSWGGLGADQNHHTEQQQQQETRESTGDDRHGHASQQTDSSVRHDQIFMSTAGLGGLDLVYGLFHQAINQSLCCGCR